MQRIASRYWKSTVAFVHDVFMSAAALLLATWMRLGTLDHPAFDTALTIGLPVFAAIAACCYLVSGMYRGIWSYASLNDLVAITKTTAAAILIFTLLMFLFNRLEDIPRSVPVITWFVLMALIGGPRFLYRLIRDRRLLRLLKGEVNRGTPILLVGAGDGAELFLRAVRNDRRSTYDVIGTIDDKTTRIGQTIHGVPILGALKDLGHILESLERRNRRPTRIALAKSDERLDATLVRRVLNSADAYGIPVFRLPEITSLTDSVQAEALNLRPIAIEDLIGRPRTHLDRAPIRDLIAGARIAVTGAGGTIGREITRQIAALGPARLLLLDHCEYNLYELELELGSRCAGVNARSVLADVRDRGAIERLFAEEGPELVFHAAALKHVPIVELNPHEGVLTNVCGTRSVADAALSAGARAMVLISTDKAVQPTNVMGASKRMAEAYCQGLDLAAATANGDAASTSTRYVVVRFGNVLGSTGSVVPLFQRQLAAGGPLTVTHPDVERFFMTVREAVELVLRASALGAAREESRGEIHVLDMGKAVKIADLARQMITSSGLRPDIDVQIAYTGLRPGEKLSEELFDDCEERLASEVDGIQLAAPRRIDIAFLNRAIDQLEAAARTGDEATVYRVIESVVPTFRRSPDEVVTPSRELETLPAP